MGVARDGVVAEVFRNEILCDWQCYGVVWDVSKPKKKQYKQTNKIKNKNTLQRKGRF